MTITSNSNRFPELLRLTNAVVADPLSVALTAFDSIGRASASSTQAGSPLHPGWRLLPMPGRALDAGCRTTAARSGAQPIQGLNGADLIPIAPVHRQPAGRRSAELSLQETGTAGFIHDRLRRQGIFRCIQPRRLLITDGASSTGQGCATEDDTHRPLPCPAAFAGYPALKR